jgi:hypothetical protein
MKKKKKKERKRLGVVVHAYHHLNDGRSLKKGLQSRLA